MNSIGNNATLELLQSSQTSNTTKQTDESLLSRRKVSFMPLVTEEDLKNSDLGQKDPEGVAQVFGDDVASRFRSPLTPNYTLSPPPYDTKDKMICRKISPVTTTPLFFESRDGKIPRGVPTVKVRMRKSTKVIERSDSLVITSSTSFEDVAVALSPVFPQNGGFYGNSNPLFGKFNNDFSNDCVFNYEQFAADIAASNPDMVHFQQVLNNWIKIQSKSQGAAFILLSTEWMSCFCQVAGDKLLNDPIVCGDSSTLNTLISDLVEAVDGPSTSFKGSFNFNCSEKNPIHINLSKISEHLRSRLRLISGEIGVELPPKEEELPPCSLFGIQARSNFKTALFIVHQSSESRATELAHILPHIQMIGTLMSIVANIEEQKRLARQSQVFLSMTQNMFSSLREFLF